MVDMKNSEILVSNKIDWLPMKLEWASLKTVIMVHSTRTNHDQTGEEKRYYISSADKNGESFANIIRSHWGIENKVHWMMDVVFNEDDSNISTGFETVH